MEEASGQRVACGAGSVILLELDTFTLTEITPPLEKIVHSLQPHIACWQYGNDVNLDHHLLFRAVLVATRPTETYVKAVYAYDTASSTEWAHPQTFIPDTWVDISTTLERKLAAMACYESELRDYPHPRSLEALRNRAKSWGNRFCLDAAKVLMTDRRVFQRGKVPT